MIDAILTDSELIYRVKEQNDSTALQVLTERHTGIYVAVAQKYTGFSDKIQIQDIKEDLQYNIYAWAKTYKPEKKMKFGTYVGEMTRYMCLDLLNKTPNATEITDYNLPAAPENTAQTAATKDSIEKIRERIERMTDKRFWTIFEARHFSDPKRTWRDIGDQIGLTHEGVRQIYLKHIDRVKHYLST